MDAFATLKADHKRVAHLFEKLAGTTERATKTRMDLFDQLNHELSVHTHLEEDILYPTVKEHKEIRALGFESVEAHRIVKLLLGELASLAPDSEEWTAKMALLRESVEHHVKDEEEILFPRMKKILSADELEDLSAVLEEEKLRVVADPLNLTQPL